MQLLMEHTIFPILFCMEYYKISKPNLEVCVNISTEVVNQSYKLTGVMV